jgi:hypothetical protein
MADAMRQGTPVATSVGPVAAEQPQYCDGSAAQGRGAAASISRWPLEPGVDAGVKELNEMTIGRTDDPENLFGAPAFEAVEVFGFGSPIPSGPAVMEPRPQGRTHDRIDPPVRILTFASEGPSHTYTNAARQRSGG